jgi:hypothetical protein
MTKPGLHDFGDGLLVLASPCTVLGRRNARHESGSTRDIAGLGLFGLYKPVHNRIGTATSDLDQGTVSRGEAGHHDNVARHWGRKFRDFGLLLGTAAT